PCMPPWLWYWANQRFRGYSWNSFECAAIRPDYVDRLNLAALASERDDDFFPRRLRDNFALRVWAATRNDLADFEKGILAGWGIDRRDPLADKRLLEV